MDSDSEQPLALKPQEALIEAQSPKGRILDDLIQTMLTLAKEIAPADIDWEVLVREGKRIQSGTGMTPENMNAFGMFFRAASAGHAEAEFLLYKCFSEGCGVAADKLQAATWLRKSAEAGFAVAECALAVRHYDHSGYVPFNYSETVKWFRKAAFQENAGAQCGLAECYEYGMGVPRDPIQAVFWFQAAADRGDETAQLNIGNFYRDGSHGFPRDLVQAYKWLKLASDKMRCIKMVEGAFIPATCDGVKVVESQMSRTEIAAGELLYRAFKENHPEL
jgi:TPR repeat protein